MLSRAFVVHATARMVVSRTAETARTRPTPVPAGARSPGTGRPPRSVNATNASSAADSLASTATAAAGRPDSGPGGGSSGARAARCRAAWGRTFSVSSVALVVHRRLVVTWSPMNRDPSISDRRFQRVLRHELLPTAVASPFGSRQRCKGIDRLCSGDPMRGRAIASGGPSGRGAAHTGLEGSWAWLAGNGVADHVGVAGPRSASALRSLRWFSPSATTPLPIPSSRRWPTIWGYPLPSWARRSPPTSPPRRRSSFCSVGSATSWADAVSCSSASG